MDFKLAVSKIYQDADFNEACFGFTEAEARSRKLWRDARPMPTNQELKDALTLANKEIQVKEAYDQMVKDIYDQLEVTFGTRNDVSAAAFANTYEAMLKRPANYVDAEIGLADEAAVTAFAQGKIAEGDAYALFRIKRIAQYEAAKTAIMGA